MNRMKPGPLAGLIPNLEKQKPKPGQTQEQLADDCLNPWPGNSESNMPTIDSDLPGTVGEVNFACIDPSVSFFLPVHYQSGYSYPLVVWLHSAGSSHRQLDEVMPMISERNYVGVSIAGTESMTTGSDIEHHYGWIQSPDAIELVTNQVASALDTVCSRFNINRQRVFIGGSGAGGTMAFRVAFRQTGWFAGVASLNGSLPANLNPLSNWRACRKLPVFWAHGRQSKEFPETNLCHQLRLLHVGGFDVTLRQYPCADQFPGQIYSDLDQWMMSQLSRAGANIIG